MGASSRLRTYQYLPYLEAEGIEVRVAPLFNDRYLKELYLGRDLSWSNVVGCYLRRLMLLFKASAYDVVVIEKELFPFLPAWAEWWLSRTGGGYFVDYDDAVFHNYDLHPRLWVRRLLGNKINKVMRYSRQVRAGNDYLKEKALLAGAKEVLVLPTVVDGDRYGPVTGRCPNALVKVGWIGSPTTVKYVKDILTVLERVNQRYPFELVIISSGEGVGFSGKETPIRWSEEHEVAAIQKLDIGIMPLTNTPWEKGKCGYKLIQYMACGLPVVGSSIGVNCQLITNERNGFLAADAGEWEQCLESLIVDEALRSRLGKEGRKMVHQQYTLQKLFSLYLDALKVDEEQIDHKDAKPQRENSY